MSLFMLLSLIVGNHDVQARRQYVSVEVWEEGPFISFPHHNCTVMIDFEGREKINYANRQTRKECHFFPGNNALGSIFSCPSTVAHER